MDRTYERKTLLSSTAVASDTATSSMYVGDYTEAIVYINATAVSGTPSIAPTVQVSDDDTTWYTHTAGTAITATGQQAIKVTNIGPYIRLYLDITGSTSITMVVTCTAKN